MKRTGVLPVLVVTLLLSVTAAPFAESSADDGISYILLDWGNGDTEWFAIGGTGSYRDVISFVLSSSGHSVSFDGDISVDGKGTTVIGGADTGGSLSTAGTTGVTVSSSWHIFVWDSGNSVWTIVEDAGITYSSEHLALGHYIDGVSPTETPDFMSAWTSIGGDSSLSFNQSARLNSDEGTEVWHYSDTDNPKESGVYGAVLYVQGYSIVTYGNRNLEKQYDLVVCYDSSGNTVWEFRFDSQMFDTSTSAVYGDRIYVPSSYGYIYSFDWKTGPGDPVSTDTDLGYKYENVKTFNGKSMAEATESDAVPSEIQPLEGSPYGNNFSSIVYDSGCIFMKHRNGMVYCFDTDLNLVWSFLSGGYNYYNAPTVTEGYVFAGFYDGRLYALDEVTGSLIDSVDVYRESTRYVGRVCAINVVKTDDGLALFTSYDDGKGMSTVNYGYAVYSFDGSEITLVKDFGKEFGQTTNYGTVVQIDGFSGVYIVGSKGMFAVDTDGNATLVSTELNGNNLPHAPLVFVNGKYFFVETYSKLVSKIFVLNIEGNILKELSVAVKNFCMAPVTVVDGFVLGGNDGGAFCYTAIVDDYNPPVPPSPATERVQTISYWAAGIILFFVALFIVLRFGLGWKHPFAHIRNSFHRFLYGEDYTHSVRKKHRLWLILLIGFSLTFVVALASLCIGPNYILSVPEALGAAWSAICKGGQSLTYEEMLIYNSRLPRTIAAFAAGIGLSVAGAVYQAVIRNPLVEPYIMGVSSGAGTLAVAVMVFGFTFFGLFPAGSPYVTVIAAMFGGLLAFGLTLLLALKTGGKSINYVLSGIVIGLVFSAVQSIMMVSAGNDIASALSWLYGSFASMNWDKVWLILIPVLALSVVPLVWAKELNLVLLGEDQARQMGLNAKRFNSFMLIFASVLTAFCVAFCGIIGFVGLVVPHLCRMIIGGDHRLVLPATIAFGGLLMIAADLISRAVVPGYELPVGAITTIIGVPMFAYLLVKRGKNYE